MSRSLKINEKHLNQNVELVGILSQSEDRNQLQYQLACLVSNSYDFELVPVQQGHK